MRFLAASVALALLLCGAAPAATMFGSLSNFDIYNQTGGDAHGFQIDFTGLHASDILGTFTYSRYGAPIISESGGVVYVRYESAFTVGTGWAATTINATNPSPTGGHQCITGPLNNTAVGNGCEHFGISTVGNPVSENYNWLVDDGAGHLVVAGTKVNLPPPVWTVPAAQNPVVHAVVQAPDPEGGAQFGDALWVRVFTTESSVDVALDDLIPGNPVLPSETETEVEWYLLQKELNNPQLSDFLDVDNGGVPAAGEAVVRRFEYYQYDPAYYDTQHEAVNVDMVNGQPVALGAFLGTQNAAADLNLVPEPSTWLLLALGLAGINWGQPDLRRLFRRR